ncbi:MAG: class I SAM-dependent methyltransferase [Acidobacteriota bacterium]
MTGTQRRLFIEQYGRIRTAEGRGSSGHDYYRSLPFAPADHPLASQWAIRATSYRYFLRYLLPAPGSKILDLGAGNGWLSNRLVELGFAPVAIDIFRDLRDGLDVARYYDTQFPVLEAEFDRLPVASGQFDLAIFNASLHYSSDYGRTLSEARRCLRANGRVLIVDSPIYKVTAHGEAMRAERQRLFELQYGFRSEALGSIEFLDEPMLQQLARELKLRWTIHKPWYGFAWHARPLIAKLKSRRPPSRFWILEAHFA